MLRWCPIKKRKTNATLYGYDLGSNSANVSVLVVREEEMRLPRPKFDKKIIKGRK